MKTYSCAFCRKRQDPRIDSPATQTFWTLAASFTSTAGFKQLLDSKGISWRAGKSSLPDDEDRDGFRFEEIPRPR